MQLSALGLGPARVRVADVGGWLSWVFTTLVCVGCLDNSCEQISERPVSYTDGTTNAARTFYESSTPEEPFLRFPAGRRIRLEHGLGQRPSSYEVVVSLLSDGGDQAPSAGNLSLVNTTDRYIQVHNDTCTDLFVRVTASIADEPSASQTSAQPIADAALDEGSLVLEEQSSTAGDAR